MYNSWDSKCLLVITNQVRAKCSTSIDATIINDNSSPYHAILEILRHKNFFFFGGGVPVHPRAFILRDASACISLFVKSGSVEEFPAYHA